MNERNKSRVVRAYWILQVFGWSDLQALISLDGLSRGLSLTRILVQAPYAVASGIVLTDLFRRLSRRYGWWNELDARALLPRAVVSSFALSCLHVGLGTVAEVGLFKEHPASIAQMFVVASFRWSMAFFVWIALYAAAVFLRERSEARARRTELEKLLQASELRTLKAQINPHFLFNALNSVRALIADDPSAAQTAVTQLARMLRYALSAGTLDFVPFDQELAMVDDYLGIEALRLGERLTVERDIAPRLGSLRIPVMTLQILVENAIKHGIAEIPRGGTLRLAAAVEDEMLKLTVENPRPVIRRETSPGIGVQNATERLRLLCGPTASLRLDLSDPDNAIACARIPQDVSIERSERE